MKKSHKILSIALVLMFFGATVVHALGIPLSSNFALNSQIPLDARTVVADTTARDAIPAIQRYDGLIVYTLSSPANYQLQGGITNGDWVAIGGGASALTDTHLFVGDATNTAVDVAASGDLTLANTGAFTIANNAVTYAKMQAVTTNKLLGSGSGTSVAEITLGTGLSFTGTTLNVTAPAPALTTGRIGYGDASVLSSDANLLWDKTAKEFRINGTAGSDNFVMANGGMNMTNGTIIANRSTNAVADLTSSSNNTDSVIITNNSLAGNGLISGRSSSQSWTTGDLLNVGIFKSSSGLANSSGSVGYLYYDLTGTHTSGTKTLTNQGLKIEANLTQNGAGGTISASGDVVSITGGHTQTAGTLTDNRDMLAIYNPDGNTGNPLSITQNNVTSTNYVKQIKLVFNGAGSNDNVIWQGNGTDPNGVLACTAGDLLINGLTNKPEYCISSGVWSPL